MMMRIAKIALAAVLIPVGLVLWIIPILPGGFLTIIGFTILAVEVPFLARQFRKAETHFPRLGAFMKLLRSHLHKDRSTGDDGNDEEHRIGGRLP
ncbi:MAG: hypothetical protein HPY84_09985 [Syntrophobacteraceae bacterium]|nr:hypothetical protein [Syntrophobacteraceae bacterium]